MNANSILQNVSRQIKLNPAEEEFFISLLEYRQIRRKAFLLCPGEVCRYEYYVIKGCLRVYSVDENGWEHIGLFAVEDWWCGDLYSFITQTPATLYMDALEDTQVWQLSRTNQELLFERIPSFERFYRIKFQNSFISLQQRMHLSLSASAEERYLNFIQKYPQLGQRIPQKQIAAYLGITPEFLSMIRKKRNKG